MSEQTDSEWLRLYKIQIAIQAADYELRRKIALNRMRRERKTIMDKIDDLLFG